VYCIVMVWNPGSETEKSTRSSELPVTSKADVGRISIAAANTTMNAGRGDFIIFIAEDVIILVLKYIVDGIISMNTPSSHFPAEVD